MLLKILILEPTTRHLSFFTRMLSLKGFIVSNAPNASVAKFMLTTNMPNILLLGCCNAEKTIQDLSHYINESKYLSNTSIIVISTNEELHNTSNELNYKVIVLEQFNAKDFSQQLLSIIDDLKEKEINKTVNYRSSSFL